MNVTVCMYMQSNQQKKKEGKALGGPSEEQEEKREGEQRRKGKTALTWPNLESTLTSLFLVTSDSASDVTLKGGKTQKLRTQ